MKNKYLLSLSEKLDSIRDQVMQEYGSLTIDQLNWTPDNKTWSIAQCLDHMILSNKAYFSTLVQVADGTKKGEKAREVTHPPRCLGSMVGSIFSSK